MKLKHGLICLLALSSSLIAAAQSMTTITASKVQDIAGNKLVRGTMTWTPVSQLTGQVIGGKGFIGRGVCVTIVNGAITTPCAGTGIFQVMDTALTSPLNLCYHVVIRDSIANKDLPDSGSRCVQPSGSTWNWDNYLPDASTYALISPAGLDPTKLPLTGGALSGPLVLPADPTLSNQAATKSYVDAHAGADGVSVTAGTMSYGSSFNISNVGTALAAIFNFQIQHDPTMLPLSGGTLLGALAAPAESVATRTIDCGAYATLTLCLNAASAYLTSGETGTGHAVEVILHDQTYSMPSPFALVSGLTIRGVTPRVTATTAGAWGPDAKPNGGTWIDCGGGTCFQATSTGLPGYANISMIGMGFQNWGSAFAIIGSSGTGGLVYGRFQDIYAIGQPTIGASDQGLVFHNSQLLTLSNINVINVNSGLAWYNDPGSPVDGGNSIIDGFYVYAYPHTVGNGNSNKPIFIISGPNFLTFHRPQYFMLTGDQSADGILIDGTNQTMGLGETAISIYDADLEGSVSKGIHIVHANNNHILITEAWGAKDTVYIDAYSKYNSVDSTNKNVIVYLAAPSAGLQTNLIHGAFTYDVLAGGTVGNGFNITPGQGAYARADNGIFYNLFDSSFTVAGIVANNALGQLYSSTSIPNGTTAATQTQTSSTSNAYPATLAYVSLHTFTGSGWLTTTAATSDNITMPQAPLSANSCWVVSHSASAAAASPQAWVSNVVGTTVTVTHAATAGMYLSVICSNSF